MKKCKYLLKLFFLLKRTTSINIYKIIHRKEAPPINAEEDEVQRQETPPTGEVQDVDREEGEDAPSSSVEAIPSPSSEAFPSSSSEAEQPAAKKAKVNSGHKTGWDEKWKQEFPWVLRKNTRDVYTTLKKSIFKFCVLHSCDSRRIL